MDPTYPPPPPPPSTTLHVINGPPSPLQKLRLMISHGGHILPRPHSKTLFYSGGETRLISVARTTALSISSLFSNISKSLFNSPYNNKNPFNLKYQLPNHDLDALISISSDEDLYNMIEEYDRVSTTARIRFFVFKNCGGGGYGCGDGEEDGGDWFGDVLKVAGSNPSNGGGEDGGSHESIVLESCSSFGSTNSSNSPKFNGINNYNCNYKGGDDLKIVFPSVDSLGSDMSTPSPTFSQQTIIYQDASVLPDSKPISVNLLDIENNPSDHTPRNEIPTPFHVSNCMVSKPPIEQPQHQSPPQLPPQTHYIHHPNPTPHPNYVAQYYPTSIPIAYPPMYQTYIQPQQHFQYHHINKPYPLYMIPINQTQNIYDPSSMNNLTTLQNVPTSQPQVSSNLVVNSTTPLCGPSSVATQPMNQPSEAQPVTLEKSNFIDEYEDLMRAQIYKTQPSGPTLSSSQLQSLRDNFVKLKVENT